MTRKVIKQIEKDYWEEKADPVDMVEIFDLAQRALEQEPKTGHWIKYGIPRCGEQHYKCTNCDEYFNFGLYSDYYKKAFKFCPNCGAKMVEAQESEEV